MLAVTPYPMIMYILPERLSSSARKNEDSWTSGQYVHITDATITHGHRNKSILSVSLHNFQIIQPNHSNFPRKKDRQGYKQNVRESVDMNRKNTCTDTDMEEWGEASTLKIGGYSFCVDRGTT